MAFSNLTSLTEDQYKALIFSFNKPPLSSTTGSPDSRVTIQLGGWVSENVLAFQIITAAAASSTLAIDPTLANTLDINILASSSTNPTTTYWTLDVGTDNRSSDWSIDFSVAANGRGTGTWKFTKGKSEDDKY
jgi:hypothetical protein